MMIKEKMLPIATSSWATELPTSGYVTKTNDYLSGRWVTVGAPLESELLVLCLQYNLDHRTNSGEDVDRGHLNCPNARDVAKRTS